SELIVRFGPQPIHRPLDHTLYTLQVALEVYRDLDVIACRKPLPGGSHWKHTLISGRRSYSRTTRHVKDRPSRFETEPLPRVGPGAAALSGLRFLCGNQETRGVELDFLVPDILEPQPLQLIYI